MTFLQLSPVEAAGFQTDLAGGNAESLVDDIRVLAREWAVGADEGHLFVSGDCALPVVGLPQSDGLFTDVASRDAQLPMALVSDLAWDWFGRALKSGDLASPQFLHSVEGLFVGHGDLHVNGPSTGRSENPPFALKKSGGVADIELGVVPHDDSIAHPRGGE